MTELSFFDDLGETLADVEETRYAGFISDPGTYAAKLVNIEEALKDEDPSRPQLIMNFEITEGQYAGSTVKDYFDYTRDKSSEDFEKKLGYIKARFVDLGLPKDYKGPIDKSGFDGVEVLLVMTAARPSKRANAKPDSHINKRTGKPYVNVSEVVRRDKAAAEPATAPTVPDIPSTNFFN